MYILGIETSCDETSAAISKDRNILNKWKNRYTHILKIYKLVLFNIYIYIYILILIYIYKNNII